MNAPTSPVTENVAELDSPHTDNEFPSGDDLALSRATDFYSLDELLSDEERAMRDRVRLGGHRGFAGRRRLLGAGRFPSSWSRATASWASPAVDGR